MPIKSQVHGHLAPDECVTLYLCACKNVHNIAVLHHDGNLVRRPQGERPLCPQSNLLSLFADEWPRLRFVILHKGKPASFRLFPVSSYVVIPGAGHSPQHEAIPAFNAALLGFLEGVA